MKKKTIISLILALILAFGLIGTGCGSSGTAPAAPAASEAPAAAAASEAPAAAETSAAAEASAASEAAPAAEKETLDVVYLSYAMGINWCVQLADALKELSKEYNLNVEIADGNFSPETQMSQVDQYLSKGVDVIICMLVDEGAAEAIAEKCAEKGVLLLGEATGFYDSEGKLCAPCCWVDGITDGSLAGKWVVDNYERLGFTFDDLSKVGYIYVTDTTFVEMQPRVDGANGEWLKKFPDFPKENMFLADRSAEEGNNMEAGYNQTAAILAAHPEMENWVIIAMQEDYASGSCRAVEDMNLVDQTILVSLGGENVIPEWDAGLTKPWYASCYFTGYDCAVHIVKALDDVMRKGVDPKEVYPFKNEGDPYGYQPFAGIMISFDDYKDHLHI